jgi:prepilin-type N-terminal cleavage/methylation domain-containing protein
MRRSAFSLIEICVVLAIIGVIGSTLGAVLMRQQRFFRGTSELITTRQSVRDALEVLTTDVRGMSVADTARLLTDSAFEFFSTIGISVVCQALSSAEVGVSPAVIGGLTSFASQPDTGDLALFYVDSGPAGERWRRYRIVASGSRSAASTCPSSSGFARAEDAAGKAFAITLASLPDESIHAGSPVRFVRRGRYSLYRASDGEWYLGYRRCNALGPPVCGTVQPVTGPYRAYSRSVDQSGVAFEYFDRSGAVLQSTPLSLARVEIVARAASRQSLFAGGRTWIPSDSARVSVAVRNRLP